jgi:uncharacterized RDD family membrane protein YckC
MDWYYAEGNERKGPVSDEALAQLASSGVVVDSTLVWRAGFPDWQPYSSVRPASTVYAAAAAAAPAPALAFCTECGRQFPMAELVAIGGRQVCAACKPGALQKIREGSTAISGRVYGGFWIRFAAVIIDAILLGVVNTVITFMLIGGVMVSGDPTAAIGGLVLSYAINLGIAVAYEGWFLVNKGATIGKMALGLRVIRASGARITWGLAIGRYFAKIVSGMILLIGYLMAAWDEEKRSLHDRICDTRVIKA